MMHKMSGNIATVSSALNMLLVAISGSEYSWIKSNPLAALYQLEIFWFAGRSYESHTCCLNTHMESSYLHSAVSLVMAINTSY